MQQVADTQDTRISVVVWATSESKDDDYCAAVRALEAQSRLPDEIVVVTNSSAIPVAVEDSRSTATVPFLYVRPESTSHHTPQNAGLFAASGDIVLFLAADATPHKGWIDSHLRSFADPQVLTSYGPLEPSWHLDRPKWLPETWLWTLGFSTGNPARLPTSNQSYRRHSLLEQGGLSAASENGGIPLTTSPEVSYTANAIVRRRLHPHQTSMRAFMHACRKQGEFFAEHRFTPTPTATSFTERPLGLRDILRMSRPSNRSRDTYRLRQRCASVLASCSLLTGFISGSLLH